MVKNKNLNKDILIKRSQEFIYELLKSIDHSVFHRERKLKIKRDSPVNSALIKIFAYRHTCENFEMLKTIIIQVAEEIASLKIKEELKRLEAKNDKKSKKTDSDAFKLIKIILFLLREEVERCLAERERKNQNQTNDRWSIIIQVARKIASTEAEGHLKNSDDDVFKLIKIILFLLREEIEEYYFREKAKERWKKAEESGEWSSSDYLVANLGDKALDEIMNRPEDKAAALPADTDSDILHVNSENKASDKVTTTEISPKNITNEEEDKAVAWAANTDSDFLVANLGVKTSGVSGKVMRTEISPKNITNEEEDKAVAWAANTDSDFLAANLGVKELDELMPPKTPSDEITDEADKTDVSPVNMDTDSDYLVAKLGVKELDELLYPKLEPHELTEKDEDEDDDEDKDDEKWMGWID